MPTDRGPAGPAVNGATLRALRFAHHLSQEALATRAGVDRSHLARLETGTRGADPAKIRLIADALDVPFEVLTGAHPPIQALRTLAGITEHTFSVRVGITRAQLHRLEAGSVLPDPALAETIATRLGVSVAVIRPRHGEAAA